MIIFPRENFLQWAVECTNCHLLDELCEEERKKDRKKEKERKKERKKEIFSKREEWI